MTTQLMTARRPELSYAVPDQQPLFAPALPTLWPAMMIPRPRRSPAPFPFDEPRTQWFYFCRNGIYALAKAWGLNGRRVLFPAYFHGVELEALLDAGVQPDFYPVHAGMRVDPDEVIDRIGPDTAAVYLIHYVGFPSPAEVLADACRRRRVPLIEDCALALLSRDGRRPLGSFGDAAVFCVYKALPTPNGGAVLVRRKSTRLPARTKPPLASTIAHAASSLLLNVEMRGGSAGRFMRQAVRSMGNAASRAARAERVPTGSQYFNREHAGLAMSRLSHVVAAAQNHRRIVELRRRNFLRLLDLLQDVAPPVFEHLPPGVCPLFYPMLVPNKQALMDRLLVRGVEAVNFWGLAHAALPDGTFPEVDELRRLVIELPCHQDLTLRAIDRMAGIVREELVSSIAA